MVSKKHDIPVKRRIRLRRIIGEFVSGTKLIVEERNNRTMYKCIDRLNVEIKERNDYKIV